MPSGIARVFWVKLSASSRSVQSAAYLESVWVLVPRPSTSVGVEKKTRLVFFTDVVVQILSNGKLTVQLALMSILLFPSWSGMSSYLLD